MISIMAGEWPRTSYRSLFKKSEILALSCQYVFLLMNVFLSMDKKIPKQIYLNTQY